MLGRQEHSTRERADRSGAGNGEVRPRTGRPGRGARPASRHGYGVTVIVFLMNGWIKQMSS